MSIVIAWIGIGVSAGIGVTGIITACVANRRAKKANKLSEDANDLAAEALVQAGEANDIAKDANKLSEDANTIIRTQAAQQSDPSHVEWDPQWDDKGAILTLRNKGRDTAFRATVLVEGPEVDELVKAVGDTPHGGKIVIPLPQLAEQRVRYAAKKREFIGTVGRGGFGTFVANPWFATLTIDIRWLYKSGKPGVDRREFKVS